MHVKDSTTLTPTKVGIDGLKQYIETQWHTLGDVCCGILRDVCAKADTALAYGKRKRCKYETAGQQDGTQASQVTPDGGSAAASVPEPVTYGKATKIPTDATARCIMVSAMFYL